MDNPSPPQQPIHPVPFQSWKECLKALRELKPGIPEEQREEFVDRIQGSPNPPLIALECLRWLDKADEASKYRWLEEAMSRLLGGGAEPPKLASMSNPIQVGEWVAQELNPLETLSDWNAYFAAGRHLWLLHCLLKCRDNRQFLVEGLLALAKGLAHWQNLQSRDQWKKGGVQLGDPRWIAKLLESLVPSKLEMPKAFVDALYAITATAELSGSLRSDNESLQTRLDRTREGLEEETTARREAEAREALLSQELSGTRSDLARRNAELEAEKKHTVRTEGFTGVARQETIQQVMSEVRRGLISRLENIRNYADRENPNREEIVELVGEIERHLATIEQHLQS